jgi:transposase
LIFRTAAAPPADLAYACLRGRNWPWRQVSNLPIPTGKLETCRHGEARPSRPDKIPVRRFSDMATTSLSFVGDPGQRPAGAEEVIGLLEPFAEAPAVERPCDWDGMRKAALVLEVLRGRVTVAEVCERHRIAAAVLEGWQRRFLEAGERALDPKAPRDASAQLGELHAKIGAQAMEIETLRKRLAGLTAPGR